MPLFSTSSRKRRSFTSSKFKAMGEHKAFLSRIKKSLYYGKLPSTERLSLPITELAAELYSEVKNGRSLDRLDVEDAAALSRNACVSPCSLVLALLYLERLKTCNPEYLHRIAPSELFLVSVMVASKFLHDDGEEDEVLNDEWAASAGVDVRDINRYEKDFLEAIEWEVFVSEQAFWKRLSGLERDVALREGQRRGWFSYTELDHLLDIASISSIAQALITISAICVTSYTASILTLIGSAFIVSQVPGTSMNSLSLARQTPNNIPHVTSETSPSPSLTASQVDLLTAKILPSLDQFSNDQDMKFNEQTNTTTTYLIPTSLSTSTTWICEFLQQTWHWWNDNMYRSLLLYSSMQEKNTHVFEFVTSDDILLKQGKNKSWNWESEEVWKEMRSWLLLTKYEQSRQTKFFTMGVTGY